METAWTFVHAVFVPFFHFYLNSSFLIPHCPSSFFLLHSSLFPLHCPSFPIKKGAQSAPSPQFLIPHSSFLIPHCPSPPFSVSTLISHSSFLIALLPSSLFTIHSSLPFPQGPLVKGGASRPPPVAEEGRRASGRGRLFQASIASAEKGGHRNRSCPRSGLGD